MMSQSRIQTLLFVFCSFFLAFVSALPAPATVRDVFAPPIIAPTTGDVLTVGETYTVTWNTTDAPTQITNPNGMIRLRKGDLTSSDNLAEDFSILDGSHNITIPVDTVPGDDYRVVLFGDSGDWSEVFSIVAAA